MNRRSLFILVPSALLAVSVSTLKSMSFGASSQSKPQATEARNAADKVKADLAKQKPNTLIVGDDQGEVTAKYDTRELRKKGYKSLSDFIEKAEPKECKKISAKCRKCPNGKIYCTNDATFASGEIEDP